ncbi:MAG: DUF4332 domain-containing protein [Candidatus Bathyarchaeota archaeon]|nr:MAG: DUF4332 domain-containing protein [Candidatus Bathyarchaeota archaeon]
MTSKRAFAIWIFTVLTSISALGTLHAWLSWQIQYLSTVTVFSFPLEVEVYFIMTLAATFIFSAAVCWLSVRDSSSDLHLSQLQEDFGKRLDAKCEEIMNSTDEAFARFGFRGFQQKDNLETLHGKIAKLEGEIEKSNKSNSQLLKGVQKTLTKMQSTISKVQTLERKLAGLQKGLKKIENVGDELSRTQQALAKSGSYPKPYVTSTDSLSALQGKLLKASTVAQLKKSGIEKIEDLLLKSPLEISVTDTMSESEATNLQSLVQLLMVPGIQHQDAVILLKSGVNSKQDLALQDTFNLGSKVARTAELYVKEGKISEDEKPTLEEISSWIQLARTQ